MPDASNNSTKQALRRMDPYEFEKLVAEVWELEGYTTTVRSKSADRGIDIEATKKTPVSQKILIQAKRYSKGNKIDAGDVRNYATLYQQVPDADTVVIVSTSEFTAEAKKVGREQNVKSVGINSLVSLVKKYKNRLGNLNPTTEVPDRDDLIKRARREEREEEKERRKKEKQNKKKKAELKEKLEGALDNLSKVEISWSDQNNRASEVVIEYSNDEQTYRDIASTVIVGPELKRIDFKELQYVNSVDKRNEDFEIILRTERENGEEVEMEISIIDGLLKRAETEFSYINVIE